MGFYKDIFLNMENIDIVSFADDNAPYTIGNSIEEVSQKIRKLFKNALKILK